MIVEREEELELLREGGRKLAAVLEKIVAAVKPKISAKELDDLAEALILSSGGEPVFKGYRSTRRDKPFPASLCLSINDEVVHGIPSAKKILKSGDVVSLDFGMRYPAQSGLITDMAVSLGVGEMAPEARRLLEVTEGALAAGIGKIKAGARLGTVGHAVEEHIKGGGFGVIRELMGHGVGKNLHETPNIPNFGAAGEGAVLKENMVLAVEPMATAGSPEIILARDGWTWRTRDGALAAHFEHTVVVTKEGSEILTKV